MPKAGIKITLQTFIGLHFSRGVKMPQASVKIMLLTMLLIFIGLTPEPLSRDIFAMTREQGDIDDTNQCFMWNFYI